MYDNYLAHYGVKGMKWGVRRDRKNKLTLSNKRKIRKLASEHGDMIEGKYIGQKTERHAAIGDNTKRAISSRRRAVEKLDSSKELDSYLDKWYKDNPRKLPTKEQQYQELVKQFNIDRKQVTDSYIDMMKEAYIKDIGISDMEIGKDYLSKYLKQ